MFTATDTHGTRITADEARKGVKYFCPVCEAPVTFKAGKLDHRPKPKLAPRCMCVFRHATGPVGI